VRRELTAVNEVTLTIDRGEIFGLIGPNGAERPGTNVTTNASMTLKLLVRPQSRVTSIRG